MAETGGAARQVSQHLRAAIEQVREDVAKVEFWADVVTGFTQPVPDYDSGDVKVWAPSEQAGSLQPGEQAGANGTRSRGEICDERSEIPDETRDR
jgi:hypothetical protein